MRKGKAEGFLISIHLSRKNLGELRAIRWEATHCEEIGTLPRPVNLVPMDVFRIRGAPCTRIVPSNRMLDFDDFRPTAIHPISLQSLLSGLFRLDMNAIRLTQDLQGVACSTAIERQHRNLHQRNTSVHQRELSSYPAHEFLPVVMWGMLGLLRRRC